MGSGNDQVYQYTLSPTLNDPSDYGILFNATSTGKSLYTPEVGTSGFASTTFNGSGGGWTWQTPAFIAGDFTISAGTVTAPLSDLYLSGNFDNAGTFTHNSGTVHFTAPVWDISTAS